MSSVLSVLQTHDGTYVIRRQTQTLRTDVVCQTISMEDDSTACLFTWPYVGFFKKDGEHIGLELQWTIYFTIIYLII